MKVKFEMAKLKSGNFRRYYTKFKVYEKEFRDREHFEEYMEYHSRVDRVRNVEIIED